MYSKKCKDIKELIQAYIDNETTEYEKIQLQGHLKECKLCKEELEIAEKSKNLLGTNIVKAELPPYFEAKFWSRVENAKDGEGIFIPKSLIPKLVGAMVLVCALIFLFHPAPAPAPEIYIVSPQPYNIVSGEDATISAAFYPKLKEGNVSLVLNGKLLAPLVELKDDHIMYTSDKPLEEGYYEVKIQVKDKKGKVYREKQWLFYVVQ